jgi:hypothetical protein
MVATARGRRPPVFDPESGEILARFDGPDGDVWRVAFSGDGSRIASGGDDGLVRIRDARTGRESLATRIPGAMVWGVAFRPDRSRMASAASDRTVTLWDARSGRRLQTLAGHRALVRSVAFSPDGRRLVSASHDQTAQIWQAESGSEFLRRSALVSFANSQRLREAVKAAYASSARYPGFGLAERLKTVAHFIKAGMTPVAYYTQLGRFGIHINREGPHGFLLTELAESTAAFFDDLKRAVEAGRVLMLVYPEFGRRLARNAGAGMDHGTAAPVLLLEPGVRGGLHGAHPDLRDLDDGDPKLTVDFRRVYATVLERWLGCPAVRVPPGAFEPLPLLASGHAESRPRNPRVGSEPQAEVGRIRPRFPRGLLV